MDDKQIQQYIKETAYMVSQAKQRENSNLHYSLKETVDRGFDHVVKELEEIKEEGRRERAVIIAHQKETNGRVTSLEWSKQYIWGSIATLVLVGGAVASLLWSTLDDRVHHIIDEQITSSIYSNEIIS